MLFHWNYEKLAGHMEDNQILQRESLKESIDTMFSFASQVSYEQDHLLPVIQASKSLFGMKLDSPPRNLLKWLENYIQKFQLDHQFPEYINDEEFVSSKYLIESSDIIIIGVPHRKYQKLNYLDKIVIDIWDSVSYNK